MELAPVSRLEVRSIDGFEIEAFVTRPKGVRRPALIVMPHGGPIGVRDVRDFDPSVQFLAAQGLAVLQVNYRGSSGFGSAFRDAGRGEWGRGIEEDIEAAVQHVLSLDRVDPSRLCIVGASYGGYAALMSAILHPKRYRCAASIAGVTDIGLIFQSSDFALSEAGRRGFAGIVGDPDSEYEKLAAHSPVYRASEIDLPVFVAHGALDRRVDVDHAFRLMAMMDLYSKPYSWLILSEANHQPTADQARRYFVEISQFVWSHLGSNGHEGNGDR